MIQIAEPLETAELLAFTRTVEAGTVSRAAAELGVPRATVGRRLARLEERLGVRLLRRTTRSLALTPAGEQFYRQARLVLEALVNAQESVRSSGSVMRGSLRVTVPPGVASALSQLVLAFLRGHPEVRVQIDFSTRLVDLRREGYDVALRASGQLEPGLIARIVARQKMFAVASPAYLAKHGHPRTVQDLRRHRCLTGFARGELPQASWKARRGEVHVEPAFSTNDLGLLRDAAADGAGIAMLPDVLVAALLGQGALVRVLPQVLETENRLAVVHPEREFLPAHVRAFIDALVAWAPTLQKTVDLGAAARRPRQSSRRAR
ncbi:LysR family transcriptional regulator [Nannocystis pusilla]|uniref:LysR family transcriptional regulator n=1 Tax=Nannocystis pusilla TaxID=889268 RepID=A0ABS7TX86_9BACT|nr:LysR family transcriptional regulator [Nannocystis pusilla]MBZ5712867.1 LysR family transcriptional regulator [Nannocystis pusilla]